MSALIILVNADERTLRHTEAMLSEAGYLVVPVTSFADARELFDSVLPDLLIADLGVEPYDGLQLLFKSPLDYPDVPLILTHRGQDDAAAAMAMRYGAAFIASPLTNPDFLSCVRNAIAWRRQTQRPIRRWLRTPFPNTVPVNAAGAPACLVDLSRGGVRLAFSEPFEIPATFELSVPAARVTMRAQRVWTGRAAGAESFFCGAALIDASADQWQRFVGILASPEAAE